MIYQTGVHFGVIQQIRNYFKSDFIKTLKLRKKEGILAVTLKLHDVLPEFDNILEKRKCDHELKKNI